MKKLIIFLPVLAIMILSFNGCDTADVYAENMRLKQENNNLTAKAEQLQNNISTLITEYEDEISGYKTEIISITKSRNELLSELTALTASFDSLNFYYEDLSKAKDRTDSLLTIINNAVLDKINEIRSR